MLVLVRADAPPLEPLMTVPAVEVFFVQKAQNKTPWDGLKYLETAKGVIVLAKDEVGKGSAGVEAWTCVSEWG